MLYSETSKLLEFIKLWTSVEQLQQEYIEKIIKESSISFDKQKDSVEKLERMITAVQEQEKQKKKKEEGFRDKDLYR